MSICGQNDGRLFTCPNWMLVSKSKEKKKQLLADWVIRNGQLHESPVTLLSMNLCSSPCSLYITFCKRGSPFFSGLNAFMQTWRLYIYIFVCYAVAACRKEPASLCKYYKLTVCYQGINPPHCCLSSGGW